MMLTPRSTVRSDENPALNLVFRGGLSFRVQLRGEEVLSIVPDWQDVYQGWEHFAETHSFLLTLSYLRKRTGGYSVSHKVALLEAMESLLDVKIDLRFRFLRVLLCESERILAHLVNLGRMAHCIGILPLQSYVQRLQQYFASLSRRLFGSAHVADQLTLGGCRFDLPPDLLSCFVQFFLQEVPPLLNLFETILFRNTIFKERTTGLGRLSPDDILSYGISGPNARASGVWFDVRSFDRKHPVYSQCTLPRLSDSKGDVFARVYLRKEEIRQSLLLLQQCLSKMPQTLDHPFPQVVDFEGACVQLKGDDIDLDAFDAIIFPIRRRMFSVESPNGEFSVFLSSNGQKRLQRCKIKAPSFNAIQAFTDLSVGQNITDLEILLTSFDLFREAIAR